MPKVLIISASDLRGDLGRTVLWRSDVERVAASGLEAGIEAARARGPSLIVVDARLPEAAAAVRGFRQDPVTRQAAIAVVSGDPFLADAAPMRAAGANAVIPSDANPAIWDARLLELLNVPRRRDARVPVRVDPWSRTARRVDSVTGEVVNISVSGLLLESSPPLEVGQKLDVRFLLPGSDEEFRVLGEVVRQDERSRSGVRFLVLRGDARHAIEAFVEEGTAAPAFLASAARASLHSENAEWEAALRLTDTVKTTVLEISLESVVVMTQDGLILDVNRAAERTLGYTRDQMVGKRIGDTIAGPSEKDPHRQRLAHLLATGSAALLDQRFEMTVHHRDGSEIPVELTISATSVNGRPLYTAFVRDLRSARRAELLQTVVHRINEESSAIGDVNGLCAAIRGIAAAVLPAAHFFFAVRDEATGLLSFSYFVDPADQDPLDAEAMETLAAHVLRTGEPLLASPATAKDTPADGDVETAEYACVEWFGVPLKKHGQAFGVVAVQSYDPGVRFADEDQAALIAMAPAIAVALERKQAESRIHYLAYHDALTGLPNRDLLLDRLQLALAQATRDRTRLAVLFLDLDRFKVINDSLGHTTGDLLLKETARRLDPCVRKGDTLARIDGDTFTVVVRRLRDPADAGKVAETLRAALSEPVMIEDRELFVTSSIGISVFPEDGADVETLLKNADTALHRAKEHGYDSFRLYDASMNAEATERLRLEQSLRRALPRDELVTYYQPVVDLASGEIHGVEALVRWRHPERGLLLPGEFISLAETTGIIREIGSWGLRTACAQARAWQEQGHPGLSVAVNLSARQLRSMKLIDEVTGALEAAGLPPSNLEIEITETSAMQDVEATVRALGALKALGVRVSIDDFGTGYSSLSQLQRLPIDTLKIDQSFVQGVTADPRQAAIVTAIIQLGHTLQLRIVAEGVETAPQLAFLAGGGCDRVQGFFVTRALPVAECGAFLAAHLSEQWRVPAMR
jgi:diguanylate cyclase (GGDEF)-like protein/PAS domain S-box-containing protein